MVHHKVEMTQKDSGVVVSNLHALNLLLVPTDILDILLFFCLALFLSKVQDARRRLPFNTRPYTSENMENHHVTGLPSFCHVPGPWLIQFDI